MDCDKCRNGLLQRLQKSIGGTPPWWPCRSRSPGMDPICTKCIAFQTKEGSNRWKEQSVCRTKIGRVEGFGGGRVESGRGGLASFWEGIARERVDWFPVLSCKRNCFGEGTASIWSRAKCWPPLLGGK